jgi:hypothetical protein
MYFNHKKRAKSFGAFKTTKSPYTWETPRFQAYAPCFIFLLSVYMLEMWLKIVQLTPFFYHHEMTMQTPLSHWRFGFNDSLEG